MLISSLGSGRALASKSPDLLPVGAFKAISYGSRRTKGLKGKPLEIVYGNRKPNEFLGQSASRSPVAFVGGGSADTYKIQPGLLAIVADLDRKPRPGRQNRPDVLDMTAIDRSAALWGKLRIGDDIILADVVSGMTTLLVDPFGVKNKGNVIENVKVQYRDPVTGLVDASRAQVVRLNTWLNAQGALDLGAALDNAGIPGVEEGALINYDAYNSVLSSLRSIGPVAIQETLSALLPEALRPVVPLVVQSIQTLPLTSELGLSADADVLSGWMQARQNLAIIG